MGDSDPELNGDDEDMLAMYGQTGRSIILPVSYKVNILFGNFALLLYFLVFSACAIISFVIVEIEG